jgi:hypothetical protein
MRVALFLKTTLPGRIFLMFHSDRVFPARRFPAPAEKDMQPAVIVNSTREKAGCMLVAGTPVEEEVSSVKNVR